jgi:hypothetical protein
VCGSWEHTFPHAHTGAAKSQHIIFCIYNFILLYFH